MKKIGFCFYIAIKLLPEPRKKAINAYVFALLKQLKLEGNKMHRDGSGAAFPNQHTLGRSPAFKGNTERRM